MVHGEASERRREEGAMSQPFIYVGTLRIKEGKLEEVTRTFKEVADTVMEHEPRVIAFHGFVNEEGTEMTVIQVHPDTASMDFHMQVLEEKLSEHVAKALGPEFFEFRRAEYYGTPSESSLAMDRQIPRLAIDIKPKHVAGFTRTTTA
jgi:quinol monooxygenase YgiN